MANETISLRIAPEKIQKIDIAAAEKGLSRTDFMLKAVDMLLNFDEGFYKRVEEYAEALKLPEYMVIQNMVISEIAKKSAKAKVWGERQEMLFEFPVVSKGVQLRMMTGEELFKSLEKMYIHNEKKDLKRHRDPKKKG